MSAPGPGPVLPQVVVQVNGDLDRSWHRLIGDAAALRPAQLVVDLAGCPGVDAAAIALLLRVHRDLMTQDGRLVLRRPGPRVRRLLSLAQVDQVFAVEA